MWRLLPRNLKLVICKDWPALLCSSTIFIRTMYTVQYSAVSTYSVHDGTAWHYQTSVKSINQSGCPDTKTFCPRLAAQRSITPPLSLSLSLSPTNFSRQVSSPPTPPAPYHHPTPLLFRYNLHGHSAFSEHRSKVYSEKVFNVTVLIKLRLCLCRS